MMDDIASRHTGLGKEEGMILWDGRTGGIWESVAEVRNVHEMRTAKRP